MDTSSHKRGRDEDEEWGGKRLRVEDDGLESLIAKVTQDLREIGETAQSELGRDLGYMAGPVLVELERTPRFRDVFFSSLYAVALEQPHKIPLLCAEVVVASRRNPTAGRFVLEFLHLQAHGELARVKGEVQAPALDTAEDGVDSGEPGVLCRLKVILRLVAALLPIATGGVALFRQLLQLAIELQTTAPQVAGAVYYNAVVLLPYFFALQDVLGEDELEELREQVDLLVELALEFSVVPSVGDCPFVATTPEDVVPEGTSLVDAVLPAVKELQARRWEFKLFFPLAPVIAQALEDASVEETSLEKHSFPQLAFPPADAFTPAVLKLGHVDLLFGVPRWTYPLFPALEYATVPPANEYAGVLFRDVCTDIIVLMEFNRREVVRQLNTLDLFFAEGLFAAPGTALDELETVHASNVANAEVALPQPTWKIEDLAVEQMLLLAFTLPHPHTPLYYDMLVVECIDRHPRQYAPVVGRALRHFYANAHMLGVARRFRLGDWMAVQLLNLDFHWKWAEWESDAEELAAAYYNPRASVLRHVIGLEVQLGGRQVVTDSLPSVFHRYLETSAVDEQGYDAGLGLEVELYELLEPRLVFIEKGGEWEMQVYEEFRRQGEPEELVRLVKEYAAGGEGEELATRQRYLVSCIVQSLCYAASTSVYHAENLVVRYVDVLRTAMGVEEVKVEEVKEEEATVEAKEEEATVEAETKETSEETLEETTEAKTDSTEPVPENEATPAEPPAPVDVEMAETEPAVAAVPLAVYQQEAFLAVLRFWSRSPATAYLVVEALIRHRLVDVLVLIAHLFTGDAPVLAEEAAFGCLLRVLQEPETLAPVFSAAVALVDAASEGFQPWDAVNLVGSLAEDEARWKFVAAVLLVKWLGVLGHAGEYQVASDVAKEAIAKVL